MKNLEKFPPLDQADVLSDEEMNTSLGGACNNGCRASCEPSCKRDCKEGNKRGSDSAGSPTN